jgi:RNA polymerase sigma factor (TIGR02999 family)
VLSSPEGAQENSPGREPGVRIRKFESPEGATLKSTCRIDCAAPSGLDTTFYSNPGLTPGAILCRPSGPKLPVSRQKLINDAGRGVHHEGGWLTEHSPHDITQLLIAWGNGDRAALDQLMPIVYDELRRRAHRLMARERPGHILETTALVNEVYLQLVHTDRVQWQNRLQFFAISSNLMRQILVHIARSRDTQKRGGKCLPISLSRAESVAPRLDENIVKLDDALDALAKIDPRKAKIVELRFFSGLSLDETAEVLQVSVDTVWRDWDLAKTWLLREMKSRIGH